MYISNGRKITLKRGIAEWFNEDCPDIYDNDNDRIFHTDISQTYISEEKYRNMLYKFIKSSYNLFCKKYHYNPKTLNWIEKLTQ